MLASISTCLAFPAFYTERRNNHCQYFADYNNLVKFFNTFTWRNKNYTKLKK